MSKKRLLTCWGVLGGVAGLGVLVLAFWPEPAGVTGRNFQRVTIGMSHAQVIAIFGGPANPTAPNGRVWWSLEIC
jgi:hypothetical protein